MDVARDRGAWPWHVAVARVLPMRVAVARVLPMGGRLMGASCRTLLLLTYVSSLLPCSRATSALRHVSGYCPCCCLLGQRAGFVDLRLGRQTTNRVLGPWT